MKSACAGDEETVQWQKRKRRHQLEKIKMCDTCGCGQKGFESKVTEVIDSIRPMLQNDGGDIELVGVEADHTVRVRLQGACRGCPGAKMTLKMGVERLLKQRVPEVKEVIAVD